MALIQTPSFTCNDEFQKDVKALGFLRNGGMSELVNNKYSKIHHVHDISLYITGSDGRGENTKDTSAIELILCYDPGLELDCVQRVRQQVMDIFRDYNEDSTAEKIYGTNKPAVILAPSNNGTLPYFINPEGQHIFFPSRMIDAYPLYRDESFGFRKTLYDELQDIDDNTFNSRKSRVSTHRKLGETGKQTFKNGKNLTHFEFESNTIYYGKDQGLEIGIKMGPLRYVQYKLVEMICELVKNKKISQEDFQKIEPNIKDKIEFLRNYFDKNKDEESINLITQTYFCCLQLHHYMQEQYKGTPDKQIYTILSDNQSKEFREGIQGMIKKLSEIKLK